MRKKRDAPSNADSGLHEVFGAPARGFLAPAWQLGHVRWRNANTLDFKHVFGFFSDSSHGTHEGFRWRPGTGTAVAGAGTGKSAIGSGGCFSPSTAEFLPWRFTLRLERAFWPKILRHEEVLDTRVGPTRPAMLLEATSQPGVSRWSGERGPPTPRFARSRRSASREGGRVQGSPRSGARRETMLKSIFDAVMERRAGALMKHVRRWLPAEGPVLDLGSGSGHLSARLERSWDSRWSPPT